VAATPPLQPDPFLQGDGPRRIRDTINRGIGAMQTQVEAAFAVAQPGGPPLTVAVQGSHGPGPLVAMAVITNPARARGFSGDLWHRAS